MTISEIWQQFVSGMQKTTALEYIAVTAGIASVWFSRLENIWVYPVGLVSTIIYIYLCFEYDLPGEASVNIYYSIMSVYGWILWSKKDEKNGRLISITSSSKIEWVIHLCFFITFFIVVYLSEILLRKFFGNVIPWADAIATATAYTGMWLMAKKKVESWYWWIATNIASVPLYFIKGLVFSSVLYLVLLIMAFFGLVEWQKRAKRKESDNFAFEKL